ncbi:MAG TPA: ATP-binding protein [Chloroflexota bacterium]|jgi:PAS domain S-box-containing protein
MSGAGESRDGGAPRWGIAGNDAGLERPSVAAPLHGVVPAGPDAVAAPARMLAALHEVATAAARALTGADAAQIAVERARELLGVDAAAVCWWRGPEACLTCLASTEAAEVDGRLVVQPGEGPVGLAYQWRRLMVVEDFGTWQAALWPSARPTHTLAAAPLVTGGRALGVLVARTYRPHHYESEHTRLLGLLAAQIGPLVELAELRAASLGAALAPTLAPALAVPRVGPVSEAEPRAASAPSASAQAHPRSPNTNALFHGMICGALLTDADGTIADVNEAAACLLGQSAEALRGRALESLLIFARSDGAAPAGPGPVAEARRTGQPVRECMTRVEEADGTRRWLHADVVPLGDDRPAERLLVSFVDVTQRREAERQVQAYAQTEKLRALGQMASGVAHDLNQYLGLVAGHGELAMRALGRPDTDWTSAREAVQVMLQAALDGAETVKRLLAFARPRQDGPTQPLAAADLLREVARLTAPRWRDAAQAQGRAISLHVESEPDATLEGWPESLREVFTNLVFNAVDALPNGGTIRLAAWRRGPRTIVEVADSGVGMSPEVQARVFEPFYSTKGERGTGLGLAMVYGIVERHGGQIAVESAPGRGTTFRLTFPWAGSGAAEAAADDQPEDERPLRVLVVDDEAMLGRMAARMLAVDGHTAVVATSGEEALRRLCAEPFDLVISDVGMGEGMNGWELARHIRAEFPGVRFALATGWGPQIDPEQARARGVGAVIGKPYRLQDLRYLVTAA